MHAMSMSTLHSNAYEYLCPLSFGTITFQLRFRPRNPSSASLLYAATFRAYDDPCTNIKSRSTDKRVAQ